MRDVRDTGKLRQRQRYAFRNRVLRNVAAELGVNHLFSVTYSAWAKGTVKRAVREIMRNMGAILNECCKQLSERITAVPAVQHTLNAAWRKRTMNVPFELFVGRHPRVALAALVEETGEGCKVEPVDLAWLQEEIKDIVDVQKQRSQSVLQNLEDDSAQSRVRSSRRNTTPSSCYAVTYDKYC